jgi:LuxR family transcriptional regulator, maltose regulon positive regulatory protein
VSARADDEARWALIEDQLHVPSDRPGLIDRSELVNGLIAAADRRVIALSAPVGYGKRTLLAQWARADDRPFAWVSLGPGDGSASQLFILIARAVARTLGIPSAEFNAETPGISVIGQVVPRLVAALTRQTNSIVLVVHNIHEVQDNAARDALDLLVDHLPTHVQLVVSSRSPVWLASPARQARGEILEIGPSKLAFTGEEVTNLLELTPGAPLPNEAADIMSSTEGWPAGVYLSSLALRHHRPSVSSALPPVTAATNSAATADFVRDEVLSKLQPDIVQFLRRTSILDVMSGPLCDALLRTEDSDRMLDSISRSNLLVAPVEASGSWYRCHTLLRTALLDELHVVEPDQLPVLHERASAWWEQAGSVDAAIKHALAGGNAARAADLAAQHALGHYNSGRLHDVTMWLERIGDDSISTNPSLALIAGWIAALTGHSADASRWLDSVEHVDSPPPPPPPPGVPSFESNRAALRGFLCPHGVEQMVSDGELAASLEPPWSPWHTIAFGVLATGRWLNGDFDLALLDYTESIDAATQTQAWVPLTRMLALRAVLHMDQGDWDAAAQDVTSSLTVIDTHKLVEYGTSSTTYAAAARLSLHHSDIEAARTALAQAMRLRVLVTWATPWASVILRLQLAGAHLAIGDPRGARIILHEIDDVLHHRPRLGLLNDQVDALRQKLSAAGPGGRTTTLSTAELRVLPYLQTHLTLAEIAGRLYVSRHTVATQAKSIYSKLGASTRGEAITRAREVGLLPGDGLG